MSHQENLQILRNARVELKPGFDKNHEPQLTIIVNDRYIHEFSSKARESRALRVSDIKVLEEQFNGGTFVVYGEKIVDYRLSTYRGFTQTDEGLSKLQEIVGATKFEKGAYSDPVSGLFNQSRGAKSGDVFLGGEWDKFDLDVKALGIGGEFENKLIYRYSPFSERIQTSLEVKRLVCENGMVADAPFVTFEVPVIDDWETNLHVVSAQLQPKIRDVLTERFEEMAKQRASVESVMKAHDLILDRERSMEKSGGTSSEQLDHLFKIRSLTDAESQLGEYYKPEVFKDKQRAKRLDSHLTQFDVFNILTEMSSHIGRDEDSDFATQRALNKVVFDDLNNKKKINPEIPESQESDFKRIFFGQDK